MEPNVFLVSPMLGEEDRFTSHWHYLIDVHPEVGQAVVDYIAEHTGLPSSKFVGADDHPEGTIADRPDFRLRCVDYDILCEHKIDSSLGYRQLERYCAIPLERPTYLVFIARNATEIPLEVLAHERYRAPNRVIRHFLWEDFYSVVQSVSGRLPAEFVRYMDSFGMKPWQVGAFGDPFGDPEAADRFRRAWDTVIERYRAAGRRLQKDSAGLGLQIGRLGDVHLVWVGPERAVRGKHWPAEKPVLRFRVFDYVPSATPAALEGADGTLEFRGATIEFRSIEGEKLGDYLVRREYRLDFDRILADEPHLLRDHLADFVDTCVRHLGKCV